MRPRRLGPWIALPLVLAQCGERARQGSTTDPVSPLQVETRVPEGEAGERSTVSVVFDRPVTRLGDRDPTPAEGRRWLEIQPAPAGSYHWLGTRTLCFTAPAGLPGATEFRARVPAGREALDGAVLPHDIVWSFATPRPALVASVPAANDSLARPGDPIVLQFNLAVDPRAVAAAAMLDGAPVTWTASRPDSVLVRELPPEFWSVPHERLVALVASPELARDRAHTLRIAPTLRAAEGTLGPERAIEIPFRTHGPAAFLGAFGAGPGGATLVFRTPVHPDTARAYLQFDPQPASFELWQAGSSLHVHGALGYATTYRVTARRGMPDFFGQRLATDATHSFTTGEREPTLQVLPRDAVLLPATSRTVALVYNGVGTVRVQARRLSVIEELRLRIDPARSLSFPFERQLPASADANTLANRTVDLGTLVPASKRGAVLVRARSRVPGGGEWDERTVLRWSDLGLAVKMSAEDGLAWTTRLGSAAPWGRVHLVLYASDGEVLWRGRSDERGIAVLPGLRSLRRDAWQLGLVAAASGDTALTPLQGDWRLDPWRFDIPGVYGAPPLDDRAFLWGDRDIYRPGETVRLAGLVRRFVRQGLAPAGLDSVTIQIRDPLGREFALRTVRIDREGTFALDVATTGSAAIGRYWLDAFVRMGTGKAAERHSIGSLGFEIAAFRAPAFRTTVARRTPYVFPGDTVDAQVTSAYWFGAPLAGAELRWTATRERLSLAPRGWDDYSFADPEVEATYGGVLTSGAGTLDAAGQAPVRFPLPPELPPIPHAIHIETTVRDVSGDAVSGRTSVVYHPVRRYAGVAVAPQFVTSGDSVHARLVVVRADTAIAAPGTPVTVDLVRREWRAVRKLLVGGRVGYETAKFDSVLESRALVSGADPLVVAFAPALAGSYRVLARVTGTQTPAGVAWFYVSGTSGGGWRPSDAVRLEMTTDRASYRAGEVARVLVTTPVQASRALLTIEREGLLESRLVDLSGGDQVFEIPIRPEYLPNVYVGIAAVEPALSAAQAPALPEVARLPRYVVGYVPLRIDVGERRLAVEVQPARLEYAPGEQARLEVRVRDAAGAGARSRVALAVVDEAVLALLGTPVPDPFAFFYQERGLGVANNDTRLRLSAGSRLESAAFKAEAGGDGAEKLAARSLFTTTAYWNPAVETDAAGTATVEFRLPDNLTSFRVVALAASGADRFGTGRSAFRVAKPLTVEPALPRFVRTGDTLEVACVVTNRSDARLRGEVRLEGDLELLGPGVRRAEIAPGASQRIAFRTRASITEPARVRFEARLGAASDAVELKLPVVEPAVPRTAATALHVVPPAGGAAADLAVEVIGVPPRALRPPVLEVTLGASALAGARPAFRAVADYPFECLEQRASRLLVATLGLELFSASPEARADSARIVTQIRDNIRALERMATPGGFAFWEGGGDAPAWMQAWAVLALARAQVAGYEVPEHVLQAAAWRAAGSVREGPSGAGWRRGSVQHAPGDTIDVDRWWRERTLGLAWFALSHRMRPEPNSPIEPSDLDVVVDHAARLGPEEQQFLALALHRWGQRPQLVERTTRAALARAEVSAEWAHVPPLADPGREAVFRNGTRATAIALLLAAEVRVRDPLAPKLAAGLLRMRAQGHWGTTQNDALALLALDAYRQRVERGAGTTDVRARLRESGETVVTLVAPNGALEQRTARIDLGPARAPQGQAAVVFAGTGALHGATTLRWSEDARGLRAVEAGYVLQRRFARFEGTGPARVGDLVVVSLELVVPRESHYLALVDPLPAGLEIVQPEFRVESQVVARTVGQWGTAYDALPVTHTERGDRELRIFADHVPAGVYVHRYVARARAAGRFLQLPATVEAMYAPELRATTPATRWGALSPAGKAR